MALKRSPCGIAGIAVLDRKSLFMQKGIPVLCKPFQKRKQVPVHRLYDPALLDVFAKVLPPIPTSTSFSNILTCGTEYS